MLSNQKIKMYADYWIEGSKQQYKSMENLYKSKNYSDCLFFGHLILEKALKALIVVETKELAPAIHHLVHLAELAGVDLDNNEKELLARANQFNIRARYPDYKLAFYKQCTKQYTGQYYQSIRNLYRKLCQSAKLQTK